MIRYYEPDNIWISGKNPDEQGMPTSNLEGDVLVCDCRECETAQNLHFGRNFQDLPKVE